MGSLENSAGSPLIMVMTEALEISAQPPAHGRSKIMM
jgi:hypothetical protein